MSVQAPNPGSSSRAFDLAVNAAGVVAILLLAGALAANYFPVIPSVAVTGLRWAGFACIVLYAAGSLWQNRDWLVAMATRRHTQTGANALVLTVAVIAILVLGNYLGTRYHARLDLTRNKQFSLAPQTREILKNLKQELKLTGFIQANDPRSRQLQDLVKEYSVYTDKLKVEMIDPNRDPQKVYAFKQAHPDVSARFNGLLIESNGRFFEAQSINEQDVTNALIKATATKELKAYFLQGHGELSLSAGDEEGLTQAKEALEKQNFKVEPLSLFETKGTVPADASVVIVAGARSQLTPQDLSALKRYRDQGGKLVVLLSEKNTGVEELLAPYGVKPNLDVVVDPRSNFYNQLVVPVVSQYGSHAITQGMSSTVFPLSRSLAIATSSPAGVQVTSLAETSDQSFGRVDRADQSPAFNPASDLKGPLKLAVAITREASGDVKPSRLVAIGNAGFLANANLRVLGNSAFFVNSVNWVADQDSMVAIPPRNPDQAMVEMTGAQQNLMFFTSVLGAPGVLLLAGGLVWWRRRRS